MHLPVLLKETIDNLVTDTRGIYIDGTLGGGGHLKELLSRLEEGARVLAFDKDKNTLEKTKKMIANENVEYIHADFRQLTAALIAHNITKVNGVMLDLGVSSFQLDEGERGFSFHEDAKLDMRMNQADSFSAADLINTYSPEDIANILWRYGEEKHARSIARGICNYRSEKPINTTLELVEIIKSSVPASYRREKHPARKAFQAIRIAVNGELDALEDVLPQAVEALLAGGRLCIITFHSLEDRIVKHFFQENSRECICPPGFPVCICNHEPLLKMTSRKPIIPDKLECEMNNRARSAKLRVAIKL